MSTREFSLVGFWIWRSDDAEVIKGQAGHGTWTAGGDNHLDANHLHQKIQPYDSLPATSISFDQALLRCVRAFAFFDVDIRLLHFRHARGRWSTFEHLEQFLDTLLIPLGFPFHLWWCKQTIVRGVQIAVVSATDVGIPCHLKHSSPIRSVHMTRLWIG